ncbi:unnamed protein product [Menidia menidia]|uniref:Phospholipid-transporting ATPase n=1 Tax=Menidia menidia TaxID=238744 RepID=A0A8S4B984_9TELE|nr:unnamed protein product [Menidia menidia]
MNATRTFNRRFVTSGRDCPAKMADSIPLNPMRKNSKRIPYYNSSRLSRFSLEDESSNLDEMPLMMSEEAFENDESDYQTLPRARVGQRQRGLCWFLSGGWKVLCSSCCDCLAHVCRRKKELKARTVWLGRPEKCEEKYPKNAIKNQKYNILTFVPGVLYQQFKFFLNLYFLVVACSQFVPSLKIGYLYTYWAPLGFVLAVTMVREAVDEARRYQRDTEMNSQLYSKLTLRGKIQVKSSDIQVGDMIIVEKNQRIPADLIFLRTSEKNGSCFIRTDQLDGETDWKLKVAVGCTQRLPAVGDLFSISAYVYAQKPQLDIHSFEGNFTREDTEPQIHESLSIENTLWASTVVASGTVIGVVIYTGKETRSVLNTSYAKNKVGLLDLELNRLTKALFLAQVVLSVVMVALQGFVGPWFRNLFRFVVLFSYIIPISLRVNLDMGKSAYAWMITKDENIPGTVVRTSTIPEELGRLVYLLTDKTGTLTQNEMIFKRLHLGTVSYGTDTMDDIQSHIVQSYSQVAPQPSGEGAAGVNPPQKAQSSGPKVRKSVSSRIHEAVKAIALCHNVTPVYEPHAGEAESAEADQDFSDENRTYQASSPDEVALVRWTESVGLTLVNRDLASLQLRTPSGQILSFHILQIFPFTSESKRMGIIVREESTGEITFYMKGADVAMATIVQYNDWLEEECGNMAREGLRTLVVAKKSLSEEQYQDFESRYNQAKLSIHDRGLKVAAVVESLEREMELLCLTGVEDQLQADVRPTLELLRNAGIKIWMLTGDKLETATCIAKSSHLVSRSQDIHVFRPVSNRGEAHLELNAFRRKHDCALVISGDSLEVCLRYYEHEFVELACQCPAVVCCRCSPTQKAQIVSLLQQHTANRTCAIGDGGNDVSMIQAADCGIGIEGKEGKQASLAADFSITQFRHIGRLLMVHGRNSYKRSAALGQFVMHRGMIISTMQAVFSSVFYFASVPLYQGFLMVGYATIYTMFPVFSLVLDQDVKPEMALLYPELYKDLTKGRSLSFKTFLVWVLISVYQAAKPCSRDPPSCCPSVTSSLIKGQEQLCGTLIRRQSGSIYYRLIDCAGILKLRNSDIELRKGETDIGRKNTRVRMVFRVHINQPSGRTVSLQAASNPIECSQRSAQELPLVDSQSLETSPPSGGGRMLLDGHNFQHDSKVLFVEKAPVCTENIPPNQDVLLVGENVGSDKDVRTSNHQNQNQLLLELQLSGRAAKEVQGSELGVSMEESPVSEPVKLFDGEVERQGERGCARRSGCRTPLRTMAVFTNKATAAFPWVTVCQWAFSSPSEEPHRRGFLQRRAPPRPHGVHASAPFPPAAARETAQIAALFQDGRTPPAWAPAQGSPLRGQHVFIFTVSHEGWAHAIPPLHPGRTPPASN